MISPANILKNVTTFPVALTYGNYGDQAIRGQATY